MTREEAKEYLRTHNDSKVQEALKTLCLWASTDTIELTIEVDSRKIGDTVQTIVNSGVLAQAQAFRLAHKS